MEQAAEPVASSDAPVSCARCARWRGRRRRAGASHVIAAADPNRIREAIDNLVDNALRFAPTGTPIVLSASTTGQELLIRVRESGPGFPADRPSDRRGLACRAFSISKILQKKRKVANRSRPLGNIQAEASRSASQKFKSCSP